MDVRLTTCDGSRVGWARDLFQAAAPFSTGSVYDNFLTGEEGDGIQAAYGRAAIPDQGPL